MECLATHTMRFTHLPSFAFLSMILQGIVRRSDSTASQFLEHLPRPFENIFHGLISESQAVLTAIGGLLWPSRRNRVVESTKIDDVDD